MIRCCVIDPPWPYEPYSDKGKGRNAEVLGEYTGSMTLGEIRDLGGLLSRVLAPDAAVFLWVADPNLPAALDTARAWGLTFATVAYYWVKYHPTSLRPRFGLGYWTRGNPEQCWLLNNPEQCWLLKRGHPSPQSHAERKFQYLPEEPGHSAKPEAIYDSIERLCEGPYLDLFARRQRPGWLTRGDQCPGDGKDIRDSLCDLGDAIAAGRLADLIEGTRWTGFAAGKGLYIPSTVGKVG